MTEERVKFQNLGESALKAEIEIKAAPAKVYAAWTEPDVLAKWFGPRSGGSLQVDRFDPSVGGGYDVTMIFSDGDTAQMVGTYREVEPPTRLVFTWQWKESAVLSEETLVTVELTPSGAGTHLTLTHERFASATMRDQHQEGWGPILERLATVLA